ncbi:MAG TPA: TPM domain-containing protein [Allosphingosinicella sp.]|nr:TPM domain-containing protein [Allosphingosinicella sp.]
MSKAAAALPRLWLLLAALFALGTAVPAAAQDLPRLTGRVVDNANLLPPEQEVALTRRLEDLQRTNSRQLVVATVPSLDGRSVEDYGFALGEAWKIGHGEADNGAILLVALAERKVRIEVGDGLEPILTDAMSSIIIRRHITPRFKANDYPGGINEGVDAIIEQLQAPPEEAERRAVAAAAAERQNRQEHSSSGGNDGSILGVIFWMVVLLFVIGSLGRRGRRGRRYGTRRRGPWGASPVIMVDDFGVGAGRDWAWGQGGGGGWGGGGFGGFGGSGGGGGGFGGFSGGGGSFGGGGASGSW